MEVHIYLSSFVQLFDIFNPLDSSFNLLNQIGNPNMRVMLIEILDVFKVFK